MAALTRKEIEEHGWGFVRSLDFLITWGREKQDCYIPLISGDYRLYYAPNHPRIRITYEGISEHRTVFLGRCPDLATLKLLEDLIGIKHDRDNSNTIRDSNGGTDHTGPR